MAEFPIERAREKLGFVPATAVRGGMDVRTGAGELALAGAEFGGAMFGLGERRKRNDDLIALSESIVGLDAYNNKRLMELQELQLSNREEANSLQASFPEEYKAQVQALSKGLGGDTQAKFQAYANRDFGVTQFRFNNALYKQRKILYESQLGQTLQSHFSSEPLEPLPDFPWLSKDVYEKARKIWQQKHRQWENKLISIKGIHSRVLGSEKVEIQEIYALINAKRFDRAREALDAAKSILPQDKTALETRIRTQRLAQDKQSADELKIVQEAEELKIENSIVANPVVALDEIQRATSLSADDKWKWRQRARSEAGAISDPDTNWRVWDDLDNAIKEYKLAPTPNKRFELQQRLKEERFDEDKRNLAQTEYAGLKTALETPIAKEDAYWLGEARNLLDEAIRERDKFSGMLKTDEALIARAAIAKMQLDKEIEEAAEAGKPIRGRDLMVTAMGLVPYYKPKTKLTREESKKWPNVPETLREPEVGINWEEPNTADDFYGTVRRIYDIAEFEEWMSGEDLARAYYDMWISKFE